MVFVTAVNGAGQEGGPAGCSNSAGPRNLRAEPLAEKLAHIDDVGSPQSHNYLPLGWAMAANTPLRRYKQNTHGGGIRDPLVICWLEGVPARGELRHQFAHACGLTPTLLDLLGGGAPAEIDGGRQMTLE